MKQQRGTPLVGFIVGVVLGLGVALGLLMGSGEGRNGGTWAHWQIGMRYSSRSTRPAPSCLVSATSTASDESAWMTSAMIRSVTSSR